MYFEDCYYEDCFYINSVHYFLNIVEFHNGFLYIKISLCTLVSKFLKKRTSSNREVKYFCVNKKYCF